MGKLREVDGNYIRGLKTDQIRYISFLAFGLDNSGCMKRMRPVWLNILLVFFKFTLSSYQETFCY